MSEEKKQKLKSYQKDYHEANKSKKLIKHALLYPQQSSTLLIFLCTFLAQYSSFRDALIALKDTFLFRA